MNISGAITALGGQWRIAYTRDVTHLFALTSTTDRYQTALHHQATTGVTILTPHWFDDSMLLGFCVPTADYEWPDPAVLRSPLHTPDVSTNANIEGMEGAEGPTSVALQTRAMLSAAMMSPDHTAEVKITWGGRKILLSTTLGALGEQRRTIEARIERAGGVVLKFKANGGDGDLKEEAKLVEDADILVTRYRGGWAYIKVRTLRDGLTSFRRPCAKPCTGVPCQEDDWHTSMAVQRRG